MLALTTSCLRSFLSGRRISKSCLLSLCGRLLLTQFAPPQREPSVVMTLCALLHAARIGAVANLELHRQHDAPSIFLRAVWDEPVDSRLARHESSVFFPLQPTMLGHDDLMLRGRFVSRRSDFEIESEQRCHHAEVTRLQGATLLVLIRRQWWIAAELGKLSIRSEGPDDIAEPQNEDAQEQHAETADAAAGMELKIQRVGGMGVGAEQSDQEAVRCAARVPAHELSELLSGGLIVVEWEGRQTEAEHTSAIVGWHNAIERRSELVRFVSCIEQQREHDGPQAAVAAARSEKREASGERSWKGEKSGKADAAGAAPEEVEATTAAGDAGDDDADPAKAGAAKDDAPL